MAPIRTTADSQFSLTRTLAQVTSSVSTAGGIGYCDAVPTASELPVSIDFYYCVGKIAVISSSLEKSVWWLLHYVRHYHYQPDLSGWEYDHERTKYFDKKVKAIRSLTSRRGWSVEEQDGVRDWLAQVAAYREVRHDLVHSYWLSFGEDHSKYTLEARDWKFEDGPVALAALREKVAEGERVISRKNEIADVALRYLWSRGPADVPGQGAPGGE